MQNFFLIPMLITFPETLLILLLGLSMTKKKIIDIKRVLFISFLQSIFVGSLLILGLDTGTGLSSILQIITMWLITTLVFNIHLRKSVIPVLMGLVILGTLQNIFFPIFSRLFNIDLASLGNIIYAVKFYVPVFLICIILLIIIEKKKVQLYEI